MASIKTVHDADALLLYRVGPVYCCSPTMQVVAVQLPPKLSHPPGSHAAEPGMFRAGSGMVRVVDLRKRFGVDEGDWQDPGRLVVVEVEGGQAGFWVDEIIDVIQYPKSGWGQAPLLVPREVFSRTLMLNEQINLYADFENLNRFRETGYLRQHIQQLKQQQVRAEAAESSASVAKEPNSGSAQTSARRASSDQSVRSSSVVQAEPLRTKHPRQAETPDVIEPTGVEPQETSPVLPPTPDRSGTNPPVSEFEPEPSPAAEAQDRPATRPVSTRPASTNQDSRHQVARNSASGNTAWAAARPTSVPNASHPTGHGLSPARSAQSSPGSASSGAGSTRFSPSSAPSAVPAVGASEAPRADRDSHSTAPPAADGDTRAVLIFAALVVLLLAGGGYFILELWQDDVPLGPLVDQPAIHEPAEIPAQAESPPLSPAPVEESFDEPRSASVDRFQGAVEDLPVQLAVQADEPVDESPRLSTRLIPEEESEPAAYRADINSDDEGLVIVLNIPVADAESVLRQDGAATAQTGDQPSDSETVIDSSASVSDTQEVTADLPATQATDSRVAAEPARESVVSAQIDGDDVVDSETEKPVPEKKSSTSPRSPPRIIIHRVVKGDTLWHIAQRYINDPFRYPELARLSRIKNPDLIYPGDKVKIIVNESN